MARKAARSRRCAPATPKRGVGWAAFLLLTAAVGIWGLLNHPTYRERRFARASLQDLERARDGNPGDAILLYHLGQRLNQQRRFGDAELVLEQAARIEPDTARLRDAWANAQMGQGKVAEAFTQLRQFVGTHPESAPGRRMLGKFYVAMHSLVRARVRREYEKAVALAPDRADAHRLYADWLLNHGDREADARTAEAEARAAIRLAGPGDADAQLLLGLALIRKGRSPEAVTALEAAAAGLPNDPVPARKLQRIYAAEGKG